MINPLLEKPPLYDLSSFTVMVVEDSAYMQELLSSMLKVFGVGDIMVCDNAQEAQELLSITQSKTKSRFVTKIDIVLTDWLMEAGSGKELLKWIRTNSKSTIRFMPVIVVSGYTTERILQESRDLGANEILVKPISANMLASRICSVIDNPRPFIESPNFFGPDRRRQALPYEGTDRRKINPNQIDFV